MADLEDLPVAVSGAGPIGLAAAAKLAERGVALRVNDAGDYVGTNLLDWAHVRIFTTWEQSVDPASVRLPIRNALGWHLKQLVDDGRIKLVTGSSTEEVLSNVDGLTVRGETADGSALIGPVDEIVAGRTGGVLCGPARAKGQACCVADVVAKHAGKAGCGCGTAA